MNTTAKQNVTINSITRAWVILQLFDQSWELGIQDISRLTGLNKTTVFRVVKSLEANGLLVQNASNNKYNPGIAILKLAHGMYKNYDVKNIFVPYMKKLHDEFNEDVILSVLSGTDVVCIDRLEGVNAINLHSRIGKSMPVCAGSTARVLLPYLDNKSLKAVYSDVKTMHSLTIPTTKKELEESINFIKSHGYLTSCGVVDTGVTSVSIPIFMNKDHVYSLGICGIKERIHEKGIKNIIKRMLEFGKELEEKIVCCEMVNK
jgi:DNA-binding IclR family transcriptional regulator